MKKIVYITGTRADFNLMTRTLLELKKNFDLTIIATGMHLSEKWGNTIKEIEKYGFYIRKVDVNLQDISLSSMVESLGITISKLTKVIEEISPYLIIVEGDRGEMLAGAIIGASLDSLIFENNYERLLPPSQNVNLKIWYYFLYL